LEDYEILQKIQEIKQKGGLTNDEILLLFKAIQSQKENNVFLEDIPERAILILIFKDLIFYSIKKLGYEFNENLYQEGLIGLVSAVDSFSVDLNVKFITYATKCVNNSILAYMRHINRRKYTDFSVVSLDEKINAEDNLRFEDVMFDQDDDFSLFVQKLQDNEVVMQIISNFKYLSPVEQYCFVFARGLFGKPKLSCQQIGKRLNVSRTTVSNNQRQAKEKLLLLITPNDCLSSDELIKKELIKLKTYSILSFVKANLNQGLKI